ncbi:hypothetical protein A3B60_01250 [Candidatus Peregrinibacteria bacterium RIFCSPLOWO2_01_FULL_39_12]|nr:MAG: hypothetical protein A3B60_01250 [Candidatus Peregrinibacteria bacterium RIFCSPLOWO2_01_FULL_39_12]OGJ42704.1 MAG: hypothetical protein A3I58_00895 [Candidatus Peregrinibacteria bacterium RIFCSPLOWO2_02_FULL_39_10]
MYKIVITSFFKKQLKRLVRKNQILKVSLKGALANFNRTLAVSVGHGVYKIRLRGECRGKSGGYRLYVFVIEVEKILVPIAIYAKNERENITLNELNDHLEITKNEIQCLL